MKMRTAIILLAAMMAILSPCGATATEPECNELKPPGAWSEMASAGGDRRLTFSDGNIHALYATPGYAQADLTGEWDWLVTCKAGSLLLVNAPRTTWYSPCDDTNCQSLPIYNMLLKVRSTRYQATNPGSSCLESEVAACGQWAVFQAAYARTPSITNVQETADTLAYTHTIGSLAQASVCGELEVKLQVRPGKGRGPLNPQRRRLLAAVILGTAIFGVTAINTNLI